MKNIVADLRTEILKRVTLYGVMTLDNFGTTVESLMIRGDPSTVRETAYIDGSCVGSQQAGIYAQSKSNQTAIKALDDIGNAIEFADVPLNELTTVTVHLLTAPTLVSKTDTGVYVYTMTLKIDYERS